MAPLILFLVFVGIPILEIAVFITLGGAIGLFPTLAMIVVTAIAGSFLLRMQGFQILSRIRTETEAGRLPGVELGHGAMILVAGVLLLTPGFVTDAMGFALFVPQVRTFIWRMIARQLTVTVVRSDDMRQQRYAGTVDLDEAEWSRNADSNPHSPWNKSDGEPPRVN